MKSSLSSSVVSAIKEQHIAQHTRGYFVLKRSIFWILFGIAMLLGAKAVLLTLHVLEAEDLPLAMRQAPPIIVFVRSLPLLWIVSFALLSLVASWSVRALPKGYKWSLHKTLGINLLASLILGIALFAMGLGPVISRPIERMAPGFSAESHRNALWMHPEYGFLRGRIIEEPKEGSCLLRDPQNIQWLVLFEEEDLGRNIRIQSGAFVRLYGEVEEDIEGLRVFEAERIVPDRPPRWLHD